MVVAAIAPEQLQEKLIELDRAVQAQVEADNSFRKANTNFSVQNETTQLLNAACEKLATEKEAMERANFEEHTSELSYLCKHFGTAIDSGLSEHAYLEKIQATIPQGRAQREKKRRGFVFCCSLEFPDQQSWWIPVMKRLAPTFQVLRSGKLTTAAADEIVLGDLVYLSAGQRSAVDGRVLVHSKGTTLDISPITMDDRDVRLCSMEATAPAITSSGNMVLKDSYLATGSLFFMVVRLPKHSLIPGQSREESQEQDDGIEFSVDMTVPPAISLSQCRSVFKALCVRASMACRSFQAFVVLAQVRVLVVLLSTDIDKDGAVSALSVAAKRLGRYLLLVNCDCSVERLKQLSQDNALEMMNLFSEDLLLANGPLSPISHESGLGIRNVNTSSTIASSDGSVPSRFVVSEDERIRLQSLVQEIKQGQVSGTILAGMSEASLRLLCTLLCKDRIAPLYATGSFHFPECFKSLVLAPLRAQQGSTVGSHPSVVPSNGPMIAPKSSIIEESRSSTVSGMSPLDMAGGVSGEAVVLSSKMQESTKSGASGSTKSVGQLDSCSSRVSSESIYDDPAAQLGSSFEHFDDWGENRLRLLVSVNSIGVVSGHADCVILKSDLGCLAQALEISAKGVPQAAKDATNSAT